MSTLSFEKIVPDTSILIEGILSAKLENREYAPEEIIIHQASLAELEHQANKNNLKGFYGLEEIQKITKFCKENDIKILFMGKRPGFFEIKNAKAGEIDALIRQLAHDENATLITADKVQAEVAKAIGIPVILEELFMENKKLKLDSYFDDRTMSVHLKEETTPKAKKGFPGKWKFVEISKEVLKNEEIKEIAKEIIEAAQSKRASFIEIERKGSTIVQLENYRIVITRPPFSERWEITAVRPLKKLEIEDYNISEKVRQRLESSAEGILVAGAPGMGKSTFAQALAEFYLKKNKVVKTVEAPRDLVVSKEITQYAISHGSPQEIHDILLLTRPDYTIFDEMRNTEDFLLFADLRLAGVGMVGVVHATNPIDAIQRFVGRLELGVIPHVVDTVIFIKYGKIDKVFYVDMQVKVPSGMTEADLARPVVCVSDFETGMLEFEIYTYGEETVVVPVIKRNKKTAVQKLAEKAIKSHLSDFGHVNVELVNDNKAIVSVPEKNIPMLIGKDGKNIEKIEKELGIKIEIERGKPKSQLKEINFDYRIKGHNISLYLEKKYAGIDAHIYIKENYLLTAHVSKKAEIKIRKNSEVGKEIETALNLGQLRICL